MSNTSIDEALAGYKRVHRALLTSKASRWRDLDISMQQLRALYLLRDEDEASVGRLAELFGVGLPAASLLADLREGSNSLLRRWMASLAPEDLAALSQGWRALAEVASGRAEALEGSA